MTVRGLFSSRSNSALRAESALRIAIVGRGFSGMMAAIALMKTVKTPFHLTLFDPNSTVSGGQALASHSSEILNSRVRDLSVSSGDPDDFNDWLRDNASFRAAVPAAIPGFLQIFVPKSIFSDYVYQRFSEALSERQDITVQVSQEPVLGIRRIHGSRYVLESAAEVDPVFDTVMLATGYGIGSNLQTEIGQVAQETNVRAQRLVARPHTVLLGTGIRMVDKLLQLRDAGYTGQITIISKHGFLPQSHTRLSAEPIFPAEAMPTKLSEIVRFVRNACREAEAKGQSWQSVMNGLRKQARSLWRALPAQEKQQFNRRLRAIYDSHRNRLPELMYVRLKQELAQGNTILRKAEALRVNPLGIVVRHLPGRQEELVHADQVIDCRCQAPDLTTPLMKSLLENRLAEPDELNLGLSVNARGELAVGGRMTRGMLAIGPLGLGSLPDIDLVPEIVTQAYAAAERLAEKYQPQKYAV